MNKKLARINELERQIKITKEESDFSSIYQDNLDFLYRELADLYFDLKGTTAFALKLTDKNNNQYYLSDNKKTQLETVVIYFENEQEIQKYLTYELSKNYKLELQIKTF